MASAASSFTIRCEQLDDAPAIRGVAARAFGPGRYAKTSERVREVAVLRPERSQVGLVNETLVGCCRIWGVAIGNKPALFLGPLAVDPAFQGAGLGGALIGAAVRACEGDALPILVVGRPTLFADHGFVSAVAAPFDLGGPLERSRLLWRHVRPGDFFPAGRLNAPLATTPA